MQPLQPIPARHERSAADIPPVGPVILRHRQRRDNKSCNNNTCGINGICSVLDRCVCYFFSAKYVLPIGYVSCLSPVSSYFLYPRKCWAGIAGRLRIMTLPVSNLKSSPQLETFLPTSINQFTLWLCSKPAGTLSPIA